LLAQQHKYNTMSTPPPYINITGISRTVMKDTAQETLANYNGNARPGEIVADLTTDPPALYVGNNLGALTAISSAGNYGNANVVANLAALGTNPISTTGNISGNFFIGNGSQLTGISAGANTGNVTFNDVNVIGTGNLNLQPTGASNEYLNIYLTGAADIHVAAGGSGGNLILGTDEEANIAVLQGGNVAIQAGNVGGTKTWNFDTAGNLTLPLNSVVYETNIPDGALSGSAIALKPTGGTTANQQLLIYPTANDGDHIHLTSGNLYTTELFLGSDNLYVKLANTGNVVINSNDGVGNTAQWNFGTGGTTQFPNSVILAPVSQSITMQSDQYSQLMWQNANVTVAPNIATYSNFYVSQNSAVLDIGYRDGSSNEQFKEWLWSVDGTLTLPTAGRINFDYLSISSDANVSAFYAPAGNVQLAAGIGDAQIVANSLNDSKTWTFGNTGNLTAPGNISAAGNITAGNISTGSGSITGGNVNGNVFNGNVAFGNGVIGGIGNITGGNLSVIGNVTAANLPTKFTGSWSVPTGNSTQSFTVDGNNSYQMWVEGNIPNGIIAWNALVTVTNTNVPVLGQQFAWNYEGGGNVLMFNTIPAQIIGTAGAISNVEPAVSNTNVFSFGINNASGNTVTVDYGWVKLS
jgi:hypothetical protein